MQELLFTCCDVNTRSLVLTLEAFDIFTHSFSCMWVWVSTYLRESDGVCVRTYVRICLFADPPPPPPPPHSEKEMRSCLNGWKREKSVIFAWALIYLFVSYEFGWSDDECSNLYLVSVGLLSTLFLPLAHFLFLAFCIYIYNICGLKNYIHKVQREAWLNSPGPWLASGAC